MNIFILEDNDERIKWFKEVFEDKLGANLTISKGIDTALHLYIKHSIDGGYDMVFLDHDLGDKDNADQNNGLKIAQELRHNVDLRGVEERIVIHSSNPVGAQKMNKVFDDEAFIMPFPQLVEWGVREIMDGVDTI